MKITVTESMFINLFREYGRADNFSREGLIELFDHLENSFDDDFELDVIGICCDFTEDDYSAIAESYDIDLSDCEDESEEFETVVDYLQRNTTIVYTDEDAGMILYQDF